LRENRGRLSQSSIREAKSTFFLGVPGNGVSYLNFKPSVRVVAEHLGLPVRPLQRIAVQQGWVSARRESDACFGNHPLDRLIHQVGRSSIVQLIVKFHQAAAAVGIKLNPVQNVDRELSALDLVRSTKSLSMGLTLAEETLEDLERVTGRGGPRQASRKQRPSKLVRPERWWEEMAQNLGLPPLPPGIFPR